ncbi:MAG: 4Fe-4S dicluster domain-containing protein [Spirochaetota bacterium]
MGVFIRIEIDRKTCTGTEHCGECIRVCPVNIFVKKGGMPVVEEENEDECTLCDLCLEACRPRAVTIQKLYEEDSWKI